MKKLLCLLLLVSCVTPQPVAPDHIPPPPEDESSKEESIDTSNCDALPIEDKTFCDEVDACHAAYRDCKKNTPEQKCFDIQEKCVIKAYRKWKKATGAE